MTTQPEPGDDILRRLDVELLGDHPTQADTAAQKLSRPLAAVQRIEPARRAEQNAAARAAAEDFLRRG